MIPNQQLLGLGGFEAKLLVEAGAIGGHQVNPLCLLHLGGAEQGFDHAPTESTALEITRYHHIPEHGPVNAIAAGPPEAHQAFAAPEAHHHGAAGQHPTQLVEIALPGPEGVFVKQPLQLQQAAAGA